MATDGSLFGKTGKRRACGWAVVQLDYEEEMGRCMGSMPQWRQNSRSGTLKRAELTAFECLLKRVIGPIKVHVDNKGIIDGLRKGEKECIKPRVGDADFWNNFGGSTW